MVKIIYIYIVHVHILKYKFLHCIAAHQEMNFTCISSVQHTKQFPLHATNSAVAEVDHPLSLELKDQQNMWTSVTSAVNQSVQEHKTCTQNPQQYTATVDSVSQAIGPVEHGSKGNITTYDEIHRVRKCQ